MLQILYNETGAIVRCEAASVICAIYEHQLIEWPLSDNINQVMLYASTSELHKEVKLQALCYWDKVIDNRLSHQGMIDGIFPEITFSSEHKKIVVLTNDEIKNRLKKVLMQLSEYGCLFVLVTALQDQYDIEVSKKAVAISKKIYTLLEKYGVTFANTDVPCTISQNDIAFVKPLGITNSLPLGVLGYVKNEIIDVEDVQQVTHGCLGNTNTSIQAFSLDNKHNITPQYFFHFIKRDLDALINERKNWLNNIDDLGSLLDNMLKNFQKNDDTNAMDCY